jgi:hypothetical protein
MFVIKRTGGSWDDFYTEALFVTESEELAKKYCQKANEVFKRIKDRFSEIDSELEDIDDTDVRRNLLLEWWSKYHTLSDVNAYSYEEIEVR